MAWWRAIQVALAALGTGSIAVSLDDRVEDRLNVAAKAAEAMVTATMKYESPQCRPRRIVCMAFLSHTSPRHVFARAVRGVCMHDVCERRSTHLERFNKGIFTGPRVKIYATFQKKCTSGMIWYQVCFYRRCLVEGAGLS